MRKDCIVLAVLLCTGMLAAQENFPKNLTGVNRQYEFVNQELRDIVYILSLYSGLPLICDDTVTGTGSFLYQPATLDNVNNIGGGV